VIVVPVLNEAPTIAGVVRAAGAFGRVLVVDDGSSDGSAAIAAEAGAEVIRHPRRLGKGQAIRTGIVAARARGASAVATLDGDGQHDPNDLPALVRAAAEAPEAIVVGSRLAGGRGVSPDRLNALRIAGFFVHWVSDVRVRDTQSGFRIYPFVVLDQVPTRQGGFVFETEILVAAGAHGWPVREVGIVARPRPCDASRFRTFSDGLAIGGYLARCAAERWAIEAADGARELAAPFGHARRVARHAAMLEAAAHYADSPTRWGWACATFAAGRAATRVSGWWRHPRLRRDLRAAWATALSPFALGLVLVQALAGRRFPDIVTPIITTVFAHERLRAVAPTGRVPAPPGWSGAPVPSAVGVATDSMAAPPAPRA
jgi:glycosyltransferase involved in cell wall biosynthesis